MDDIRRYVISHKSETTGSKSSKPQSTLHLFLLFQLLHCCLNPPKQVETPWQIITAKQGTLFMAFIYRHILSWILHKL